ncbi:hypothetical protein M5689_013519 [Euphorbia peplus]|nr:hypothetical protein M5689_013519 [Euphorbia peplus]
MGNKKQQFRSVLMIAAILMWWMIYPTAAVCSSRGGRSACKQCVGNQMKHGCPSCAPMLQCMGRCLWGGSSKSKCIKKCDRGGAMLTLSDCKKCMSTCKCSCVASNFM